MILNKALLLKCLGGVAACLGTASLAVVGSGSLGSNNVSSESESELKELIEKVGLSGCTSTDSGSNECDISNLKVKYESGSGEENKTKQNSDSETSGKIKVYSDDTYSNKFKFVIEDGDIALTGGTGTITKLEQFETYEIKEEDSSNNWYLTRKTKAAKGIKSALGLPEGCNLPETTDASSTTPTCTINTADISKVKFEGEEDTRSSAGNIELTITKLSTSDSDFPFDYKFELKATSSDSTTTLTLGNSNTISLKSTEGTEFRIKKTTGNNITLEELWSLKNQGERVGLDCNNSDKTCTLKTTGKINIKQDQDKSEINAVASSDSSSGKIKVYTETDTTDYEKGFKFVIEEGDITVGSGSSKKLEQFETYEIKKEDSKWYLTRKEKAADEIKRLLGLPSNGTSCTLPTSANSPTTCSGIDETKLKAIKFDGKQEGGATFDNSGEVTLTITKVSDTNYPFGYKFTIQPTQKLTISTSPENSIPANMDIEFKIKKTAGSNQISLEKAWTLETLAAKAGLESCNNNNECSIKTDGINVKHDETKEDSKTKSTSSEGTQGKIKVYKDSSGYKEGFKFVIEDGDISLTGSTNTISKLEQFETYEIEEVEESGTKKYYLSRKNKAFKEISKALGLPTSCDEIDSSNKASCTNLNETKLQGISFDGKGNNAEVEIKDKSGSNINLKVTKLTASDTVFPHGYKFVLESDKEINIPKTTPTLTIKKNTNIEFKIKVTPSSEGSKTLTLEKAWTVAELGKKVGISSCNTSSKECTFNDNASLNVSLSSSEKIDNAQISGTGKKLKYEEDQEGYNQGIRFYVDESSEDIDLTNGTPSATGKKIEKKSSDGNPTYEIKEDSGKWYLTKKTNTNQNA